MLQKTEHLLNYPCRLLHNTIFLKAEFKAKLVCLGLITKAQNVLILRH